MEETNYQFVVDENGYKHILGEEIGRGGQGITWRTQDPNILVKMRINPVTGEPVVDEEAYEAYKAEIDEVRVLDIPRDIHIAKPVSMLKKPYCGYTMKLLNDMKSIKYWIRSFDGIDKPGIFYYQSGGLRHRYKLLMNIAEIFTKLYAHSAVYADLSPENILVSGTLDSSEVWLIDADNMRYRFDIDKQIVTPGYGAPEVVNGGLNSLAADEYSFAIIAHEVLTMTSPFNGSLLLDGDTGGWDDDEEDYAELARKGEVAWIFDPNDDSNQFKAGLPAVYAFTEPVRKLFERTFSYEGRHNPESRPTMREWYLALRQAVGLTGECTKCHSTFLIKNKDSHCPFCRANGFEREKVFAAFIVDEFNVDSIVAKVNEHVDEFNRKDNSDSYFIEGISADEIKKKKQKRVETVIIDNIPGTYYLYNYHTFNTWFGEKNEPTIAIEVGKGEYEIRNLMSKSIKISTANTNYGEISPSGSMKIARSLHNIILKMSVIRDDSEDHFDETESETDNISEFCVRNIIFCLM